MSDCKHMSIQSVVRVARLEDAKKFVAEITIGCIDCNVHFRFLGLPCGLNLNGATMSVDAREARLAIEPEGESATPLDLIAFQIQGFKNEA